MAKVYYFINRPGTYFVETDNVRLNEDDAYAYAARETKVDSKLLEKVVNAGFVGFLEAEEDWDSFQTLCKQLFKTA